MRRTTIIPTLVTIVGMFAACGDAATEDSPATDVAADASVDVAISTASIVINELAAAGEPADWIELYNAGTVSQELGGWTLTDSDPTHTHVFAGGQSLGAGAYLVLLREEAGGFLFGLGPMDSVNLYDADGALVDHVGWEEGASPSGASLGRIPNGTGSFETLVEPTPATENTPNPQWSCGDDTKNIDELCDGTDLPGGDCEHHDLAGEGIACASDCQSWDTSGCVELARTVVINEATSSDDDAIELLNPGDAPVDLSGWSVTDESEAATDGPYVFDAGVSLDGGAYLVLRKDVEHLFGLGGADSVRLRDADGLLIDHLTWPQGGAALSFCRIPNGTGAGQVCDAATFGSTNTP